MNYKTPILLITLSALSTLAHADHKRGLYLGGALALVDSDSIVSTDATRDSVDLPALELMAGYKHNGWLGLELRYGMGTGERDLSTSTAGESLVYSVDSSQSIYWRPEITNAESKLYFLLGHSKVNLVEELKVNDQQTAENDFSVSGLSYGLGAGWFFDEHININIEYRVLVDDDETEFSAASLSVDYRFKSTGLKFW